MGLSRPGDQRVAHMQDTTGPACLRPERGGLLRFLTAHRKDSVLVLRHERRQSSADAVATTPQRKQIQAEFQLMQDDN